MSYLLRVSMRSFDDITVLKIEPIAGDGAYVIRDDAVPCAYFISYLLTSSVMFVQGIYGDHGAGQ